MKTSNTEADKQKQKTAAHVCDTDLYEQLTENYITFIVDDDHAEHYLRTMKAPKCKDLFITTIDGDMHVPHAVF